MKKLRIGVVGLGSIAQKAYLPILCKEDNWELVGAYSPNQSKAKVVCDSYRISLFADIKTLASHCDAIFVHSATSSHFEIVKQLLEMRRHVYIDKPLTDNIEQSEQLIELAIKQNCMLMVGFNRRFAPFYISLKQNITDLSSLRMDKHRSDSVGPKDVNFTLLDDYLHVVDTVLWMVGSQLKLISGDIKTTGKKELFYAEHHFQIENGWVTTSMHRKAGSQQEQLIAIEKNAIYQLTNMNQWRSESQQGIIEKYPSNWDSILVQRGFDGAIRHFIESVSNQSSPYTSGEQAIAAQRIIEKMRCEIE